MITDNLQMKKLKNGEVKKIFQGHWATKWQSQDLNPGCLNPKPMDQKILITVLYYYRLDNEILPLLCKGIYRCTNKKS